MTNAQRAFACEHLGLARQQAHRFDPSRGHRPSSYLVPKVKGELLHHIRDTGFAVRISHRLRELWIRARRPLELWLECRRAFGQRPVQLDEKHGL
jgi:RNA polymerase sigma-B factor